MTLDQATKGDRTEVSVTKKLRIGISGHSQRTKDGPQSHRGLDLHYDLGKTARWLSDTLGLAGTGLHSTLRLLEVWISL
ncbi:MAG: hypothetical protein QNK95_10860 [Paracoccaceae bacterium]